MTAGRGEAKVDLEGVVAVVLSAKLLLPSRSSGEKGEKMERT
jgi:hypothetical protein